MLSVHSTSQLAFAAYKLNTISNMLLSSDCVKCSKDACVYRSSTLQSRTLWLLSVLMTDAIARSQVCFHSCVPMNSHNYLYTVCLRFLGIQYLDNINC